jgi:3-phenylpropionate/cinnamic acid dioxygenase small subunit
VVSPEILAAIDALQVAYVRALDRFDMAAWLGCFEDGAGSYVCTTRENDEQDLPLALMMDDSPARLIDRTRFIDEVWAGTFEEYTTRHFIQRLDCAATAPGRYRVESNFMVVYTTDQRNSEILCAGLYVDDIIVTGTDARFTSKRAVLDTITTPRYLVYPV